MKKNQSAAPAVLTAAFISGLAAVPAWALPAKLPEGMQVEGQSLAGMTVEEAARKIEDYAAAMGSQTVILEVHGKTVSTTASALGFCLENTDEIREAMENYENGNLVKRYMMAADLQEEPLNLPMKTAVSEDALKNFVEENCRDVVLEPRNASIILENGAFQITPEVAGYSVNLEATAGLLQKAMAGGLKDVVIVHGVVEENSPWITAADLATIQDVLGTFSTDFSSSGPARSTNLSVGAAKINGRVLMPGETLSGYECLQPFTAANGYQAAAAYENGQVVDSIGGGVCQIATTLYNASLLAELQITQRQNHSMAVGYVKPSRDAAIAGTYKDIKVTNNYGTPIYVEGKTKGRTLTFTIYGKETRPPNRQISFLSETLSITDPGAPKEILNRSMAPGSRRQVQSAHKGMKSRLWKVVTVDGVEQERILLSTDTYNPSPAVVQVGPPQKTRPAPAAPSVPETEPAPSPSPAPALPETSVSAPTATASPALLPSLAPDVSGPAALQPSSGPGQQSPSPGQETGEAAESAGQSRQAEETEEETTRRPLFILP